MTVTEKDLKWNSEAFPKGSMQDLRSLLNTQKPLQPQLESPATSFPQMPSNPQNIFTWNNQKKLTYDPSLLDN